MVIFFNIYENISLTNIEYPYAHLLDLTINVLLYILVDILSIPNGHI